MARGSSSDVTSLARPTDRIRKDNLATRHGAARQMADQRPCSGRVGSACGITRRVIALFSCDPQSSTWIMMLMHQCILANANCGTENVTLRAPRQQKTKTRPKYIQTCTRLSWRVDCKPRVAANSCPRRVALRIVRKPLLRQSNEPRSPNHKPRQAGYMARFNTILCQ
jgi:hypothetical protein